MNADPRWYEREQYQLNQSFETFDFLQLCALAARHGKPMEIGRGHLPPFSRLHLVVSELKKRSEAFLNVALSGSLLKTAILRTDIKKLNWVIDPDDARWIREYTEIMRSREMLEGISFLFSQLGNDSLKNRLAELDAMVEPLFDAIPKFIPCHDPRLTDTVQRGYDRDKWWTKPAAKTIACDTQTVK